MLFSGQLRSELDPWGRAADDDEILAAVGVADAEDVLGALPDGLDTAVDERARSFSGGQRQRLVLTRALLSDAEILVLVEPTSAVDAHTEARIARRLHYARAGRTTVIVTTSPLMLDQADRVVLVEGGRVVAEGSHRELLSTNPAYRDTVTRGVEPGASCCRLAVLTPRVNFMSRSAGNLRSSRWLPRRRHALLRPAHDPVGLVEHERARGEGHHHAWTRAWWRRRAIAGLGVCVDGARRLDEHEDFCIDTAPPPEEPLPLAYREGTGALVDRDMEAIRELQRTSSASASPTAATIFVVVGGAARVELRTQLPEKSTDTCT